jgi:hypothetical protein
MNQLNFSRFLPKIVTGDETWCFLYDPKSKRQSLQWKRLTSPQLKKICMLTSQMNTVLITFFNVKGIVLSELIQQGKTVNQAYNVKILKRLHEAVCRKRPEL